MLNTDAMALQLILQLVYTIAERFEVAHVENLGANVEMQPHELHIRQLIGFCNNGKHVTHGYAKLVFCQTCGDVCMGMCTNIRIQTESDSRNFSFGFSQFVDNFQFGNTLYVETENVVVESGVDLPVALANTSINNLPCGEACLDRGFDLSAADAVGTQSRLSDDTENTWIGIGLDSVVHDKTLVFACFVVDGTECLAQQFCIVVVERRLDRLQLLYGKYSFCHISLYRCVVLSIFYFLKIVLLRL